MAAKIKILSPEQWAIIKEVLSDQGLILIPEENLAELLPEDQDKLLALSEQTVDYDFGGEPDVCIDIVHNEDSYATQVILEKDK